MILHKDKNAFMELVAATASNLGLQNFQVEKDYFVSLFLKELSVLPSSHPIVFKGGTSLSKCYSIIDRFSEDIDLAVQFKTNKVTPSERKQLKNNILDAVKSLKMSLLNGKDVKSKRDYNEYHIGFDSDHTIEEGMVPHIIVETIVVYRPYPCVNLKVSNHITKYLVSLGEEYLISRYQLEPFEMLIQSVERTFVDKLFAICDYHLDKKYNRYSRHIYDIHMIWCSGKLNKSLIQEIIPEVIKDRQLFGLKNVSCQPGVTPNKILKEIVDLKVYEADYEDVTTKFIYIHVAYDECIVSLNEIIDVGIIPNLITV
jgi:predicted nucleotidyltransferase component of viral defense system